jgi:hypothetical protein
VAIALALRELFQLLNRIALCGKLAWSSLTIVALTAPAIPA